MIELSGLRPIHSDVDEDGDIKIVVTGLRPGEKLFEELLISEDDEDTTHPKIRRANETHMPLREF